MRKFWMGVLAGVGLSAAVGSFAVAGFETGNEIFTGLNGYDEILQAYAGGYIIGVSDTMDVVMEAQGSKLFCTPEGVTTGQVRDVARKYLGDNPDIRHHNGASTVITAMMFTFPCPTDPPSPPSVE